MQSVKQTLDSKIVNAVSRQCVFEARYRASGVVSAPLWDRVWDQVMNQIRKEIDAIG